jgi:uncharacterized protein YggE
MKTILALLFLTLFLGASATAQDIDKMPTIAAVGTVEVEAVPDEVNFSLEVTKIDKDLQVAKRLNDESISKILELTRRFDVKPQNVKTHYISVEMKYETVRDPKKKVYDADGDLIGTRVFKGYEVSKTVLIKLTDVSRFEQFFEEVLKTGITEVKNVSFETSKYRELRVQARELATKAARDKAVAMAAAVNQTVGKAIFIREGVADVPSSNSGRSNNFVIEGQDSNDNVLSRDSSSVMATFAPGAITVKSSVTIVFVLN